MMTIETPTGTAVRFGQKDDAPLLFEHGGNLYATNLFKMHDTHGFSLADSLIECRNRGWTPCTEQFVADAIRAGWTAEKARAVVSNSMTDSR